MWEIITFNPIVNLSLKLAVLRGVSFKAHHESATVMIG